MADSYTGEIRLFAFTYAPVNWAWCDGALVPIQQNPALFSILGTQYGGNGQTNFALPNLTDRFAVGSGRGPGLSDYAVGRSGGVETVTLVASQLPAHQHQIQALNTPGTTNSPAGNMFAVPRNGRAPEARYAAGTAPGLVPLHPQVLPPAGNSQPHDNMPPFLAMNFAICLSGEYPSRP